MTSDAFSYTRGNIFYSFFNNITINKYETSSLHEYQCSQFVAPRNGRRGFVVRPVRVPEDGQRLPEGHPAVVGQTRVHADVVANVEVRDVVGVHPLPRKGLPLVV